MGTAPGTHHGTLEPFEDGLGPPVPFRLPPHPAAGCAHDERLHALGRLGGHVPRGADGLAVAVDIEREAVRDQLVPGAAGSGDDDAAARAERGDVGGQLDLDELVRRTLYTSERASEEGEKSVRKVAPDGRTPPLSCAPGENAVARPARLAVVASVQA